MITHIKKTYCTLFLAITGFLIISSCCTEKDCDVDNFPQISFALSQNDNQQTVFKRINILGKASQEIIDSIILENTQDFTLNKWVMQEVFDDKREFKQYDYMLITNAKEYSVHSINYERTSEKTECNTCFPFGDGSATVTDFNSLAFKINHMHYEEIDSVLLN